MATKISRKNPDPKLFGFQDPDVAQYLRIRNTAFYDMDQDLIRSGTSLQQWGIQNTPASKFCPQTKILEIQPRHAYNW